jgi:MFS family permease
MAVQPIASRLVTPLYGGYAAYGTFWGAWVVVFAEFLAARSLSEGEVGLWLATVAVVSILTMTLLAPRMRVLRLSFALAVGHLCMGAGGVLLAYAPTPGLLPAFVVLGVGYGVIDVFVNVGAQDLEADLRRPVLQYVAACYNLGGIAGALGAGAAIAAGIDHRVVLAATSVVFGLAGGGTLLARDLDARHARVSGGPKVSLSVFWRSPALIVPAVVVLAAYLLEGSMDIWSVIYLRETLSASVGAGALAFAAFSLAMAIGRLTAARVLFGLGYRATLLVSGCGALAAGLVAALTTHIVVAGIAFLFMGLFIASAAPAAFGIVAETDEDPTLAIAGMVTVGYSGFIVGPPIMGWLAQTAGLRTTMVALVSTSLGVIAGGLAGRRSPTRAALTVPPE